MGTTIRLQEDFKEFLRLLEETGVKYLLVGGYAVGYYGYPRPTGDLDIWVSRELNNAERLVTALDKFGFKSPELSSDLFTRKRSVVRLGVPPFKLEIITDIDGVEFDSCFARKQAVNMDGCKVTVISLADLRINKRICGRPKDMDDLENLG